MDIVLVIHSFVRFLILLAALVGIILALVSLIRKSPPEKTAQMVSSAFVGLYDLQVLLGLLIILLGGLTQAVHPIVMAVGVVSAHWMQSTSKHAKGASQSLMRLALFTIPLLIILVGLTVIGHLPI